MTAEIKIPSGYGYRLMGLWAYGLADVSHRETLYVELFDNLEHCALAVTRCRTGQQGANSVNSLTRPANHAAHISPSKLQPKGDRSAVRNFREHHVIGKFDQLANDELEKFSHPSKD